MVRRLSAFLVLAGFLATMLVAARHNHFLERRAGPADSACIYCSGAMAAGPGAPVLAEAPSLPRERAADAPASPALPYLLKLDHSGGAPPLA